MPAVLYLSPSAAPRLAQLAVTPAHLVLVLLKDAPRTTNRRLLRPGEFMEILLHRLEAELKETPRRFTRLTHERSTPHTEIRETYVGSNLLLAQLLDECERMSRETTLADMRLDDKPINRLGLARTEDVPLLPLLHQENESTTRRRKLPIPIAMHHLLSTVTFCTFKIELVDTLKHRESSLITNC